MMKKIITVLLLLLPLGAYAQGVVFERAFSPAEGLVKPVERPCRDEICLNGYWQVQCVDVPKEWKAGEGKAPELPMATAAGWDETRIKVPSPINVNNWGQGYKTGEGTDRPYVPSSVYFPSYPEKWNHARMAWMRRNFVVPTRWSGKRVILHFEAVSGDCTVYVNGMEAGHHFENHLPFEIDVTDLLTESGENELLLGLRHHKLFDKKHPDYPYMSATYPHGSNTDDLIGVWQDVFLQAVPEVRLAQVFVQPYVSRGELVIEAVIRNDSPKTARVSLDGDIRSWVNLAGSEGVEAAEIAWTLSESVLGLEPSKVLVKPGEEKKVILTRKIKIGELDFWSPSNPNLYTAVLQLSCGKEPVDIKSERFGWREFTIEGSDFLLNGEKIQCFGDIQHPFSSYICSRRFAWSWYRMIKDFGGNAVRPHAQPWPRCYYDLADEMGLMVLDETALFGSSIRLNFEEDITWENCCSQLESLILRDRNHPSVVGWSAGNETFAIALLNKAPKSVAAKWDEHLTALALHALECDPTRSFVTLDGDRDMGGRLPVWSKHFGHGLKIEDLPSESDRPLVVGEQGATYYGRPDQLVQFAGMLPYLDYKGRNEALGRDIYQNVRYMALPYVGYFSPSELSWFGIEHMNLGYSDFSRLPGLEDGVFPGLPYEEGVPGYQYERIPPYVTTFNPYLDPSLPVYKPLAMFNAYKAALSGEEWPAPDGSFRAAETVVCMGKYNAVYVAGGCSPQLSSFLGAVGVGITNELTPDALVIVDASSVTAQDLAAVSAASSVFALSRDGHLSRDLRLWLPEGLSSVSWRSSAFESDDLRFTPDELYFGGSRGADRYLAQAAITGAGLMCGNTILRPSRTDWTLFNDVPEHWKCAQVVLFESLEKPDASCLSEFSVGSAKVILSTVDYSVHTESALKLWRKVFAIAGLNVRQPSAASGKPATARSFNLLLDGPVD